MFYKDVEFLSPAKFKPLTVVKREVFELMLDAIYMSKLAARKYPTHGVPAKSSHADKQCCY
jgi:hypothetical protein